jgi:RimJ/RimL family protein N-acetyltransferase
VFAYRALPVVSRFQTWEPRCLEEVLDFIATLDGVEPNTPGTWFQFAVTLRDSGTLIGDCGMRSPADDRHQVEIGITLSPPQQGKGHATEALTAVLDHLFGVLHKHRVFASTDPGNQASINLLRRVGLRQEGHFRESFWCKGAWADDVIFAILDWEWSHLQEGRSIQS